MYFTYKEWPALKIGNTTATQEEENSAKETKNQKPLVIGITC